MDAGTTINDRGTERVAAVLAPVLALDPVAALAAARTPPVRRFVWELWRRDPMTTTHVVRVGELAVRVADRAGLSRDRVYAAGLGALLHDIGKFAIPHEILSKPGRLTDAEWYQVREHALKGAELIAAYPELAPAVPIVRGHHERADGCGYPDGLEGDEIPPEVGLVSVCDAWDALTTARPYREAFSREGAAAALRQHAGRQWDAALVELVLAELADRADLTHPKPGPEGCGDPLCDEATPARLLSDATPA
jgi:HD-GYP domain-containing protein (c-di-GMP phosphodiesterase class II)